MRLNAEMLHNLYEWYIGCLHAPAIQTIQIHNIRRTAEQTTSSVPLILSNAEIIPKVKWYSQRLVQFRKVYSNDKRFNHGDYQVRQLAVCNDLSTCLIAPMYWLPRSLLSALFSWSDSSRRLATHFNWWCLQFALPNAINTWPVTNCRLWFARIEKIKNSGGISHVYHCRTICRQVWGS